MCAAGDQLGGTHHTTRSGKIMPQALRGDADRPSSGSLELRSDTASDPNPNNAPARVQTAATLARDKITLLERAASDPKLEHSDVRVAVALLSHLCRDPNNERFGQMWPSISRLAEKAQVGERSVFASLRRLLERGYILILRRGGGRRGGPASVGQTNIYRLGPGGRADTLQGSTGFVDTGSDTLQRMPSYPATNGADTLQGSTGEPVEKNLEEKNLGERRAREADASHDLDRRRREARAPDRAQSEMLLPIAGSRQVDVAAAPAEDTGPPRSPRLYLASHGCTFDTWQPGLEMAAWAAKNEPTVSDPIGPRRVESFKDYHRTRGTKIADFDAAYRRWLERVKDLERRDGGGRPDASATRDSFDRVFGAPSGAAA